MYHNRSSKLGSGDQKIRSILPKPSMILRYFDVHLFIHILSSVSNSKTPITELLMGVLLVLIMFSSFVLCLYRTVPQYFEDMEHLYPTVKFLGRIKDQARGRLGRNSRPRGRNFALNGTQGEVGVSLKKKKKKFFFFFRETHFHSVTTQMQAVVTLSDYQSTTTASCFSFH